MKISKIFAIASAAVLMVACGTPAAEGSKEVRDLLPSKTQIDSTSYLVGVNFGSWIKGNDFGELNYDQMIKGIKDFLKSKGTPQDSTFGKQFKIDPNEMNTVLDGFVQKRRAYTGALNKEKGDRERPRLQDHRTRFRQEGRFRPGYRVGELQGRPHRRYRFRSE